MTCNPIIYLFLLQLLLSISYTTRAEGKDQEARSLYQAFYLTVNLAHNSINQARMQQRMEDLGYDGFQIPGYSLGIGYTIHNNNWISQFAFNYMSARISIPPVTTRNVFKSFSYTIGYDFLKGNRWSVYPYLGYRLDYYKFQYERNVDSPLTMNQYFSSSVDAKEIYNYRSHLDIGCGFSYQYYGSYTLRIGYALPFRNSRWRTWSHQLEDHPGFSNRFYISLVIGIGFMLESKKYPVTEPVMAFIAPEDHK